MDIEPTLAEELALLRESMVGWRATYDEFVARLHALGVGAQAPKAGERFPSFSLPDHRGRYRTLQEVAAGRPLVLSFNRGVWCPYCRIELEHWSTALEVLLKQGGAFAVVSAEIGGGARVLA